MTFPFKLLITTIILTLSSAANADLREPVLSPEGEPRLPTLVPLFSASIGITVGTEDGPQTAAKPQVLAWSERQDLLTTTYTLAGFSVGEELASESASFWMDAAGTGTWDKGKLNAAEQTRKRAIAMHAPIAGITTKFKGSVADFGDGTRLIITRGGGLVAQTGGKMGPLLLDLKQNLGIDCGRLVQDDRVLGVSVATPSAVTRFKGTTIAAIHLEQHCVELDRPDFDTLQILKTFAAIDLKTTQPMVYAKGWCPPHVTTCPPDFVFIKKDLGRLCSGTFNMDLFNRFKARSKRRLTPKALMILFNAPGAMRGYLFKKETWLNSFFYSHGAARWLPEACADVIVRPGPGATDKAPAASKEAVGPLRALWKKAQADAKAK
jgi:hypothetical protein